MKAYPVHTLEIARGETIAYRQAGGGPVVVLLHGNMSSSVHWQTTMQQLENAYRVYAPDLRGFGDSSYNNGFDSLRDMAEDVKQFIDAAGIREPFTLAGWSTGGGVALELAADWPDRVRKVILIDSVGLTGYPMFKKDAQGQPILTQPLLTRQEIAADPVQVLPALAAYATQDRAVMRTIWDYAIYNLHQPPKEDYELYLDAILKQRNLVDVDYALTRFNMTSRPTAWAPGSGRAALVKCPVVVMQGEKDLVVPMAMAQGIKDFYKEQATMVLFAGAGHSPITDIPDDFFKALREALA